MIQPHLEGLQGRGISHITGQSVPVPHHRLPIVVVDAPSLETLRARLDQALGNLIYLWMSPFIAGELD